MTFCGFHFAASARTLCPRVSACEMCVCVCVCTSLPSHTYTVSVYVCLCPSFLRSLGVSGSPSLCFFCLRLLCLTSGRSVKQQRLAAKPVRWFCVSTQQHNMKRAGAT